MYQPDMGHQNAHAINIVQIPWRLHFHPGRFATNLQVRGPFGLLPWIDSIPRWRLTWRRVFCSLRASQELAGQHERWG